MKLVENSYPVCHVAPQNVAGVGISGAVQLGERLSMELYNHATILVQTHDFDTGRSMGICQSTSLAGAGEKTLAISKYWSAGICACSLAERTPTANLVTLQSHSLFVFEIDAAHLDVTNGFKAIRLNSSAAGLSVAQICSIAIMSQPRYSERQPMPCPTVDGNIATH